MNKFNILFSFMFFMSMTSWAQVTCVPEGNPVVKAVPLNVPAISAGQDMPLGTGIFSARYVVTPESSPKVKCSSTTLPDSYEFGTFIAIDSAPLPLTDYTGGPFGGAIYQTRIPGVGVALSTTLRAEPLKAGSPKIISRPVPITENPTYSFFSTLEIYVNLIKIGDIAPGSYQLSAEDIPSFKIYFDNAPGKTPVLAGPYTTHRINISGSMTVNTQTCQTSDVFVNMGNHEIPKTFRGKGSTTNWIDVPVQLTNCPVFYGYYSYNSASVNLPVLDSRSGPIYRDSKNNNLGIRITPLTDVIDATKGIMAIDTSSSGSALGVGIQLGWGSPSAFLLNFNNERTYELPKDGNPTIRLPLVARYIQTADSVKPGRADGKAVFLINYY